MNPINRYRMTLGARDDAKHGLQSAEERLVADLGPRPKFDPANNSEHAAHARARANQAEVEELREDIVNAENDATDHVSTWLSALGLLLALIVEFVGATLIMDVVGVSDRERLPLALALAFAILGITALAVQRTTPSTPIKRDDGGAPGALQIAKRSIMTIVIIAIYTIVVLSIAVVRVTSSLGDDAAPVEVMARTTVMLVATLGPPWLAEWLVRRRTPAIVARKRLKILRSRLRVALRARTRAEGAVNQIVRGAEHWDREHARRKALYEVEHRLEVAKVSTERGMP